MSQKRKPKFGQNFLTDDRARYAIVEALGDLSKRTVLEIGPGHGSLTAILADRAERLIAVELDPALAAELTFRFRNHPNVTVVHADILATDLNRLVSAPASESPTQPVSRSTSPPASQPASQPASVSVDAPQTVPGSPLQTPSGSFDVIGNLPYYITSDILLKLFAASELGQLKRAVLMMQREVADRVSASPGVRDYGMLSATTQMYAEAQNLFTLPPSSFSPPPDVYSTVLRLEFGPRFAELGVDPAPFTHFLRICFAQKRKTLANNLRAGGFDEKALHRGWPAEISPLARAESITLEGMARLFRALHPPPPDKSA